MNLNVTETAFQLNLNRNKQIASCMKSNKHHHYKCPINMHFTRICKLMKLSFVCDLIHHLQSKNEKKLHKKFKIDVEYRLKLQMLDLKIRTISLFVMFIVRA